MHNKSRNLKINLSNFLCLNALIFHFNTYAQNSSSREWVSSINNLIGAVRSMSPVLFMLGLVFLIATVGIWIWFPRLRQQTSWVWGSIVLIIVVYFVGGYFAEPLKNTFSAVLDPIKWITPNGG